MIDIFIGGGGDRWIGQNVFGYYTEYAKNHPNSAYFTWTEGRNIRKLIEATPKGEKINIISHSWGGDTAAWVATRVNRQIDVLVTIDPVSCYPPSFKKVKQNVSFWVNINHSGGSWYDIDNTVAGIGQDWGDGPEGYADYYTVYNYSHGDFTSSITDYFNYIYNPNLDYSIQ